MLSAAESNQPTVDITRLQPPLLLKDSHTTFEELIKDLERFKVHICGDTVTPIFLEYSNCFIFSVIILFIIIGVIKFCHYHFSEAAINKLSLRPLIWALVSLFFASSR